MKIGYLKVFLYIAIILLSIELVLEYRARERGFDTLFLGGEDTEVARGEANSVQFPFRSPVIKQANPQAVPRVWISSASYAEDTKRSINELFPNIMCDLVKLQTERDCQVINAAKAGFSIGDNLEQLEELSPEWKPNFTLLYSMNIDINTLSFKYLDPNGKMVLDRGKVEAPSTGVSFADEIEALIEKTTIYTHLHRYVSGGILLSSVLYDEVGDEAALEFKKTLETYISASKKIGATPVLVTFATKYTTDNYRDIPYDDKLFFVRYNEYLSALGWVRTIDEFNQIIRDTAIVQGVPYIDLAKEIAGKEEYFSDFVHFTKKGHESVGQVLAQEFPEVLDASRRMEQ